MLLNSATDILAARVLAALKARKPIEPISAQEPQFDLADAYAISAAVLDRRVKRGEVPVGWKIGFTNRTIWDEYGIDSPIWGPMYDTTVVEVQAGVAAECALSALLEPRIEPEIGFRVSSVPEPGMEADALLACVDGVTHGFEVVQSIYPAWKAKAADTIAAFAMHGRYFHRPLAPVNEDNRADWLARLGDFRIALLKGADIADHGEGKNVLGGPLEALRYFVDGLSAQGGARLKPGDIVTTGTVTRALPVAAGEVWSTVVDGLPLEAMEIRFA